SALAAALALVLSVGAQARSLSGAYLAGKSAEARNDYAAAASYYGHALQRDPRNLPLRARTLRYTLLHGDLRAAASVAGPLADQMPNDQLAALALIADDFRDGGFDDAVARMSAEGSPVTPLLAQLLTGWAEAGRGDAEAMEAAFGGLMEDPAARVFALYNLGLARASLGDHAGAADALGEALETGASRDGRPVGALAAALEMSGRPEEARAALTEAMSQGRASARLRAALARMDAGESPAPLVLSARAGAAETFHSFAGAINTDRNRLVALLYARIALALRPELDEARLLAGALLLQLEAADAAEIVYRGVAPASPLFPSAEIGRADALTDMDRLDEAVSALTALAETSPEDFAVQVSHASALRRAERWEEAAAAYDAALALVDPIETRHWAVFYERGIAHERAGAWQEAEADFFKALELEPDQPHVLNYLGYSWVEQRRNFDEAQEMIEKAVAQRPEDGYITDSLGWVLYRVGKFEEAVPYLERAVELRPTDPIINDHLGDALWMVGRTLEANFQWRRALSFEPEDADAERIRRKLDVGLDRVLAEEAEADAEAAADAAEPAASSDDG
ncbi:MAG: tetratricopeptide repeat protein, partial [Pseudomonadota bacterium]